jgi:competence protein ComEC
MGIALIAMPLTKRYRFLAREQGAIGKMMGWILATLIITFAATIFTAPLIAYHFKTFTAVGLIANLIAVPLVGFALQPTIIAASALSLIDPSMAFYVWKLAGLLASSLIHIARITSDIGSFLAGKWALSWQGMFIAYAVLAIITFICWNYWLTFSHDTNRQPKGYFSRVA